MHLPTTRRRALVALALAGSLLASGCGSSDDDARGGHDGHGGGPAATTAAGGPKASATAVDRAFVRQMVPHHQMAVEMAGMAAERSRRPQIRKVAAAIVRAQDAEIAELRRIAGTLGVRPAAMMGGGHGGHDPSAMDMMAQDGGALGLSADAMGMSMEMGTLERATPFDRAFIDLMIPHHQGAIRMARAELARGRDRRLRTIARAIVRGQAAEIEQMNGWRRSWYGAPSPAGGVPPA